MYNTSVNKKNRVPFLHVVEKNQAKSLVSAYNYVKKKLCFSLKKVIIKIDCKSFFPRHGQTIISNENNYIVE